MPVINTEYGLLRNTDGQSVITIREDKIPFKGVKSFAVESATTNLFGRDAWEFDADQSTFFPSLLASGKTWEDCWDTKQRAYVGGQNITVYGIHSQILDLGQEYSADTKITLSWKHKGYLWSVIFSYGLTFDSLTRFTQSNTYEIKGDASLSWWQLPHNGLHLKINGVATDYGGSPQRLLDRWYDIEITYTLPANTRYIQIMWDFFSANLADGERGVKGYIHKPQLEISPFCSSFVAGSRPNGRYVIPTEKLGFNIETDNWVVTYMKYPIATQDKSQNHSNLCSLGQWIPDYSKGYILWGKGNNMNKYYLYVLLNDATGISNNSDNTFNPTDYFYHWHHEVIKREGNTISYYVDGIKQVTATIPSDRSLKTPFDVGLVMGGIVSSATHYPHNSLISNLAYGRLQTGEFSDSYIAFLASANKPFAAKPKSQIY